MIGKTIHEMKIGDTASMAKTVTEYDIYQFAGVTGDFNPIHINEEYAAGTFFKGRIAHGMLSAGFISAVVGTKLPGTGCIYMGQTLNFKAPVRIGDTITTTAEVVELIVDENRVRLKTTCTNQDGVLVVDGEALMSAPKK